MYCCSHKINTWKLAKIHVNTVPFCLSRPLSVFCLLHTHLNLEVLGALEDRGRLRPLPR